MTWSWVLPSVLLGITGCNLIVAGTEAAWRLYGYRTPEAADRLGWPAPIPPGEEILTFDLIVPARDEAAVIGDTLRGLLKQTHPNVRILVSLCADDAPTIAAVRAVLEEPPAHHRVNLVTARYATPSKAQQLNRALAYCTADVVGVIDAEDDVADDLLRHVEALFRGKHPDVVQGGVQLMNLGRGAARWFQVHNVMEYFFWFTSRMAFHARTGFVPLGGNTVFVRHGLLVQAGGWPESLTEDCALGVKLCAQYGATVATAYSANLATREEAPPTLFDRRRGSLFWQRDRWVRGFLAEFMHGTWRRMPTVGQKVLAGYILATPLLQAASFVLLPAAVVTGLAVRAPLAVAVAMFIPFVPIGVTTMTQVFGLAEFCRAYGKRASAWHYASLVFLTPVYQLVLAAAAAVAAYKYATGDTTWYKTGRLAEHRQVVFGAGSQERAAA
jgi:cellulose synthase/poly-beta-1,6-N-acetylglucosamine synthase-like glycosyltransferase